MKCHDTRIDKIRVVTQCRPNEVFARCRTCEGRCGENGHLCPLICRQSGCECPFRDGYVRDSSGNCIPSGHCPTSSTPTGTTAQTTTQTMPSSSSNIYPGDSQNAETNIPNTKPVLITENLSMYIEDLTYNMPLTSCVSQFIFYNGYMRMRGK
uniref:TIL domain-containing protein n=1 Tax=Parascaris equorum TaxID=6256 RepID=A0A914RIK0_PAREQ